MLTHHRKPICLSLVALDLPVWSVVETAATVYEKTPNQFHVLLTEPIMQGDRAFSHPLTQPFQTDETSFRPHSPRLLWLEISPYRVIMTMQGNGISSYRHYWEQGVYGISRYWLQDPDLPQNGQLRLRNYTRSLLLFNNPTPQHLRIEYELWAENLQMGRYVLDLEIQH
ncbi:MAG: hypothetical protein IGR76_04780 [Synechococcales cyanobacterium T60_A2020_003]|nr:hypothetical protein [Synechococcales cyanobacterium T60_A2020_003]